MIIDLLFYINNIDNLFSEKLFSFDFFLLHFEFLSGFEEFWVIFSGLFFIFIEFFLFLLSFFLLFYVSNILFVSDFFFGFVCLLKIFLFWVVLFRFSLFTHVIKFYTSIYIVFFLYI